MHVIPGTSSKRFDRQAMNTTYISCVWHMPCVCLPACVRAPMSTTRRRHRVSHIGTAVSMAFLENRVFPCCGQSCRFLRKARSIALLLLCCWRSKALRLTGLSWHARSNQSRHVKGGNKNTFATGNHSLFFVCDAVDVFISALILFYRKRTASVFVCAP